MAFWYVLVVCDVVISIAKVLLYRGQIENCAGEFPLWLAPVHIRLLPVKDSMLDYCRQIEREAQHQFSGADGPAERALRITKAVAGTDDAPQHVGQPDPDIDDRGLEPAPGVDLRGGRIGRRRCSAALHGARARVPAPSAPDRHGPPA